MPVPATADSVGDAFAVLNMVRGVLETEAGDNRLLNEAKEQVERVCRKYDVGDFDICGLCGQPGADKIPHPNHWPGEQKPDTDLVHSECEQTECARAHAQLSDRERKAFLRSV